MKQYLLAICFFFYSFGLKAQERIAFLDSVAFQIDRSMSKAELDSLKAFVRTNDVEYIFDLPSDYQDIFVPYNLSTWEGPLHDSLRALAPGEFISDYIDSDLLVLKYYLGHLKGEIYDVRKDVIAKWDEEMEYSRKWHLERDSIYNSFHIGEKIYFILNIVRPPMMKATPISEIRTQPFEIIPCSLISKIDTDYSFEVIFLENMEGIKNYVHHIKVNELLYFDDHYKNADQLLTIKKGEKVRLSFTHFQRKKPTLNFNHYKFKNSCFSDQKSTLKLKMVINESLAVIFGPNYDDYEEVEWSENGFTYEGIFYEVVADKKRNVQYFVNRTTKKKFMPIECSTFPSYDVIKEQPVLIERETPAIGSPPSIPSDFNR